ncbi:MAG: hypothetical protein KBD78_15700 [Oligoflexales bacterium]|nr:hypothetical protein [Oligoflexales bacterium]
MQKDKHEIVTGNLVNGKIENPFWAGEAFYFSEQNYFEMHISLFDIPWYASKNKESDSYTIFKEKIEENGKLRFRCPLGKAFISDKFKSYLKISVPLWNPSYQPYINLYPSL